MPTKQSTPSVLHQRHLPVWAKTVLALFFAPMLALFIFAKFAGYDSQLGMVVEAFSYKISGGPINKASTEMSMMLGMVSDQTELLTDMRNQMQNNQLETMKAYASLESRLGALEQRVLGVEGWASIHSTGNSKVPFP